MDDLLKAYELEVVQLRLLSSEFARRYPKVAGKLQIAGDACEDPHVERLIQSVALIAARISKRLDDDYPRFTERLLDVLHPHYMRPLPPRAIVRFDRGASGAGAAPSINRFARGSVMESAPVHGMQCRLRTAYEVVESPGGVAAAKFSALIEAPPAVRLPIATSCSIDIEIDNAAGILPEQSHLRLFVDAEPSFSAALLDTLFMRAVCAHLELDDGSWVELPVIPLRRAGRREEEALIPFGIFCRRFAHKSCVRVCRRRRAQRPLWRTGATGAIRRLLGRLAARAANLHRPDQRGAAPWSDFGQADLALLLAHPAQYRPTRCGAARPLPAARRHRRGHEAHAAALRHVEPRLRGAAAAQARVRQAGGAEPEPAGAEPSRMGSFLITVPGDATEADVRSLFKTHAARSPAGRALQRDE